MKKIRLQPVIYLYGVEDLLIDEELRNIHSACLTPGFESMNYHVYYPDGLDAVEVVSTAETLPAFSEKRLVVVKRADTLREKQRALFLNYVKDPSPSTCLVFVAAVSKLDRRNSFIRYLSEKGLTRCFRSLPRDSQIEWIKKEAGAQGKEITGPAAALLQEIGGGSLRAIKGEVDKLALFVGEKDVIEEADVSGAGLDCRVETIFKLSDAIGRKDLKEALRIYGNISNEPPLKILGAIARHIRILLKVKALLKKGTPVRSISSMAGIPPNFLSGYLKSSRLFRETELSDAINIFYGVDRDLKSSRMPGDVVMTKLIIDLSSPVRRGLR
ncbi:MAG: DNA polymerase III subunit delta [Thermodesulfobacteriota bacterium]|nr:MAG: DNA polymerase III subunit delta [Thermodesulfobacteriota bacterium]